MCPHTLSLTLTLSLSLSGACIYIYVCTHMSLHNICTYTYIDMCIHVCTYVDPDRDVGAFLTSDSHPKNIIRIGSLQRPQALLGPSLEVQGSLKNKIMSGVTMLILTVPVST